MDFYQQLWTNRKRIFNPDSISRIRHFCYRLSNLMRVPQVCLLCGKEKGWWRDGRPVCYKCELMWGEVDE